MVMTSMAKIIYLFLSPEWPAPEARKRVVGEDDNGGGIN